MSNDTPIQALSPEAIEAALKTEALEGWTHRDARLERTFTFDDFIEAFGWMTRVALVAETMGHHPEWFNVYRTVRVQLHTHDASPPAVTDKDLALARAMNRLSA